MVGRGIRGAQRLAAACAVLFVAAVLTGASPAGATDPAATFDAPGQVHDNACVHLAGSSEPLRFPDGTADGFTLTDQLSFYNGDCATGQVRLDLHEIIPSTAGRLAFHRGGNGYNDAENVKYGELAAGDIADELPAPVPSGGGRGAP